MNKIICRLVKWLAMFWLVCLSSPLHAFLDLTLSSLVQKGKHHEVIEMLEPELREGGGISSFRLMMLAGSYYEVGKYRQALETTDRLDKSVQAGDSTVFGADLAVYPAIIRGAVALDQGLLADAVRHGTTASHQLKTGQIFYESQSIMIGSVLGVAHALSGNATLAREQLECLRQISLGMNNLGPEKFTAMARIQMALKDYEGALASINDPDANVSPLLTMFYDPTFQNVPRFFMRSKSLLETGRREEARAGYDDLLKYPQIGQYGTLYWILLHDRARIAIMDGDVPLATELLQRAIEVIEERRSSIGTEAGRIGFVGDKQSVYAQLVSLLLQQGRAQQAFDVVERAKSRALVDMLATKTDFAGHGADPEQTRQMLAQIDALDHAAQEKRGSSSAAEESASQQRSLRDARRQLAEAAPQLASLVSVGITPASELFSLLSPGEVLVEYYYAGSELHAFVLLNGRIEAVRLDGAGIEQDVQAWRNAIGAAAGNDWQAQAERLHARLWQPLDSLLAGARRVVIVAHGALHYLPFAALRTADGRQLVDRYVLSFLPSASVLRFLAPSGAVPAASMLVLGNPDLGDPKLDLKFAGDEAQVVSRLYPDARLLLRRDASETNFRSTIPAFRRLHIASHGSFDAEAPLQSGLHLAGDAQNDGILTVGELYGIQMNAELVTLSACETGLGRIASGDDVVGLSRGFLYAGARAIVASLWSVDDKATGVLMQSFYRNLGGQAKAEALRNAQISTRQQYPHPFFWAAFQLTGRPD